MRRAVFLHGTDGSTGDHWFPWLKDEFESSGYDVFCPSLPVNHTPNRVLYSKFLKESDWNFEYNVLVGHSSGATTILNLLSEEWFPKQRAIVLIATFLNEHLTRSADWYEKGQFDDLFPANGFDLDRICPKAGQVFVVHSDDDSYCSYADAKEFCAQLNGRFVRIHDGHHLGTSSGVTTLPDLTAILHKNSILS